MSKVYDTLKKKNDPTVEVYPNVERQNLPDGVINSAKLEDRAVILSKLSDALQSDINHFEAIYDYDNDKITVTDIEVVDDINVTNVIASDSISCVNITSSNNISGDNINANTYTDADNDELKVLVTHCINASLVDVNSNTTGVAILLKSSRKTSITTYNDLADELSKNIFIPIFDESSEIMGMLEDWDSETNHLYIYVGDGNGALTQKEFVSANVITDNVQPI